MRGNLKRHKNNFLYGYNFILFLVYTSQILILYFLKYCVCHIIVISVDLILFSSLNNIFFYLMFASVLQIFYIKFFFNWNKSSACLSQKNPLGHLSFSTNIRKFLGIYLEVF